MKDIVDKKLFTIHDFAELKDYVDRAVFTQDPEYDELKSQALRGESNPTFPGQPMPIFRAGKSSFHFRSTRDDPNYEDYDGSVDFFDRLRTECNIPTDDKKPHFASAGEFYALLNKGQTNRTALGVPFDVDVPNLMHKGVRAFELPSSDPRPAARVQEGSLLYNASLFREQKQAFKLPDEWLSVVSERWPSTARDFRDWVEEFDCLYDKAVDAITKTSSTGCSISLGSTKGAALKSNENTCKVLVFQRLLLLLTTPIEYLHSLTPTQLIQEGFVDAIRIFLKREPHKYSKRYDDNDNELELKRWRIISSCSLIDELVDRIMFTLQNKAEIRSWHETPSMPGVGFSDDVSADTFFYKVLFPQAGKDFLLLDFSGWDWGLKQDMLDADADVRSNRCGGRDLGTFRKRALTIGYSVFVLDDGTYYEQCVRGIMKSGWLNTSSSNSRDRALITLLSVALAAEKRGEDPLPYLRNFFIIAMGDDSVEEKHVEPWSEFMDQLLAWGLRPDPKFTGEPVDIRHIEFCSHSFDLDEFGRVHANLRGHAKCIAKFLYFCRSKRDPQQIAGIRNALRHAPELPFYEQLWQYITPELWHASWHVDSGDYVV